MATLTTIAEKLLIARAYYLELLNADVAALMSGKKEKNVEKIKELGRLIRALDWDVSDEVNDDDTTALYELLLKAISYYSGATLSVDTDVVIPNTIVAIDGVSLATVLADYALLPDRILTGLEYSYLAPTATISAGTYKIDNVEYSANSTPFPITPTTTGLLKYVRFYATTSGTINKVESTPSSVATHPAIPSGTLGLYEILVNDAGVSGGATADLSGYVPYNGATSGLDLGSYSLTSSLVRVAKSLPSVIFTNPGVKEWEVGNLSSDNFIIRSLINPISGPNIDTLTILSNGSASFIGTVSLANPTVAAHAVNKGYADATYKRAEFGLACSDETTDLTSGTAKVTFRIPYDMTIANISASVNTAPVGSTLVVDINENGTSILSTKLSIDATEKTSTTAAVPYVLSDTAIAADSEITIDIDQVGASTAGKGLKVFIIGTRN